VTRRLLWGAVLALPTLIVVAGILLFLGQQRFERAGPLSAETVQVVPRGAGLAAIAEQLASAGVVEDATLFRLGVRLLGRARGLKAGEYLFPAGISMRGVLELLESGRTVVHRVTFPEGLTSAELVALLNGTEGLSETIEAIPPEGTLLPETYHYSLDDPRSGLLARMQADFQAALDELWPKRAEDLPFDDRARAVVLASIVEKETAVAEERPLVAGVFVNRLRRGMRLQSDPTVVYALTAGQGPLGRALTREDLQMPSPYNTYLNDGLPPGPIANPGRASLEAALNPAETGYLYFVADGNGGHVFAETLEEHNRNVAKWRKLKRQQQQQEKGGSE